MSEKEEDDVSRLGAKVVMRVKKIRASNLDWERKKSHINLRNCEVQHMKKIEGPRGLRLARSFY